MITAKIKCVLRALLIVFKNKKILTLEKIKNDTMAPLDPKDNNRNILQIRKNTSFKLYSLKISPKNRQHGNKHI